jgi:hypothetical protein
MPKATLTPPASETRLAVPDSLITSYKPVVEAYQPPEFPDGVRFLKTGLEFTRDLTKDEWKQLGGNLKDMAKAVLWWLGDWILYGDRMFAIGPDEREMDKRNLKRLGHGVAAELAKITGYSTNVIHDVKSVCLRVEIGWRHPNLTVYQAREILQAVPDAQFPYWAHRVLTENLSTREVRIELRKSLRTEAPSPTTTRPNLFAQEHVDFVRKFMVQSETWTEAEWQAHAAWHEPILKAFRSRGL